MFTLFKTLSYNLTLISSLFADGIQELFFRSLNYEKTSPSNNFVSVTLSVKMESSDKVIDIYNQAYQIKGIIAI